MGDCKAKTRLRKLLKQQLSDTSAAKLAEQICERINESVKARQFMIVEPEPYSSQTAVPNESKSQQQQPSSSDAVQQAPQ